MKNALLMSQCDVDWQSAREAPAITALTGIWIFKLIAPKPAGGALDGRHLVRSQI